MKHKYTKEDKALVKSLILIRDKGICHYTHWRAVQEFNKIKLELEKRFGTAAVMWLYEDLLYIDPAYPDGSSAWSYHKITFANTANRFICAIAPEKEALKYMDELKPWIEPHIYECHKEGYYSKVENLYNRSPYPQIRHDDKLLAKWRKFN